MTNSTILDKLHQYTAPENHQSIKDVYLEDEYTNFARVNISDVEIIDERLVITVSIDGGNTDE